MAAAFDFSPWALPFYSANRAFGCPDSSEGWVARWVVVPFPNSFFGSEDRQLDERLQTESELRGVLAKAVESLPALMARGRLPEPDSVREAKSQFVAAADAVRAWVTARCTFDPDEWIPRTKLYRAYVNDEDEGGGKRLSPHEFYNRVGQIGGIRAAIRDGVRGFAGITLAGQMSMAKDSA